MSISLSASYFILNAKLPKIYQVYQVGSGTSSKSWNLPSSRFLYATGSCRVCVRTSLQNRSRLTEVAVALDPVTSKTPAVTRKAVSVVTTLVLATHSANSPRWRAVSPSRCSPYLSKIAAASRPALSARVSAARKWAWKFPNVERM